MNKDLLIDMFEKQKQLNDRTFQKNSIHLTTETLIQEALNFKDKGPNSLTNEWLKKYAWALGDELRELKDELFEKWWSKDNLDMQNIRVEIVDIFHFAISLSMAAGMEAGELYDLYTKKGQVNHKRQAEGYNKETKDEKDNLQLEINFEKRKITTRDLGYEYFCEKLKEKNHLPPSYEDYLEDTPTEIRNLYSDASITFYEKKW